MILKPKPNEDEMNMKPRDEMKQISSRYQAKPALNWFHEHLIVLSHLLDKSY